MTDAKDDAANGEVVEFGWEDEAPAKPLSGRRLKAKKEAQKKKKPGTFGGCAVCGYAFALVGESAAAGREIPFLGVAVAAGAGRRAGWPAARARGCCNPPGCAASLEHTAITHHHPQSPWA
jgi:hypothetical protein